MKNTDTWYGHSVEDVVKQLETDRDVGLPNSETESRRAQYGLNKITEHKGDGPIKRFLLQFHQPLVYILLAAALVTLLLQEWVDTAVIFGVVIANAIIGFIQEAKALQAISALSSDLQSTVTVIREGKRQTVAAAPNRFYSAAISPPPPPLRARISRRTSRAASGMLVPGPKIAATPADFSAS